MRAPHSAREAAWQATMSGTALEGGPVLAHREGPVVTVGDRPSDGPGAKPSAGPARQVVDRQAREEAEAALLTPGATVAHGPGHRARPEEPDPLRTCFERDRDRVLHSSAFRRLAGKTQVFVFPKDHQRTRLTHALEVAQVATAVARATGLNVALTEAIALAHDCGHGPGGHASEDAFSSYLEGGYNHAIWGAEVVLAPLNLCAETLDGIRNHSWSLPSPRTPEGAVVSWADRCAYCAHDLEDAVSTGIVDLGDLPDDVGQVVGRRRSEQLAAFINELVECIVTTGHIGMRQPFAGALAALRNFNYEHIYTRPSSVAQGRAVIAVLRALVDYFAEDPSRLPPSAAGSALAVPGDQLPAPEAVCRAVTYVGGMTDAFAFETAVKLLGWDPAKLPARQH